MKYKATEDGEYECIGFNCALKGKEKEKLMLIFRTEDGKDFTVRPHMTLEERGILYKKMKDDYSAFEQTFLKKKFTLVYHSLTKDGIPSHIIDCILRDYE